MQAHVVWFIAAFVLIAAELMSGTLYLLVICVGAGAAGVVALLGAGTGAQLAVASAISLAGIAVLKLWRRGGKSDGAAPLSFDAGQPVEVLEQRGDGALRVAYRGTQWDAKLEGGAGAAVGARLVIVEVRGNTLIVRPQP